MDQHRGAAGHAAPAGKPTTGRNTAETIAAPIEISTVVASGSSPRLMAAFQPAWHAAANSTAAKTSGSMARIILNVCGRSAGDRHLLPARDQSRNAAPAHTFGAARWYCLGRATSAPRA